MLYSASVPYPSDSVEAQKENVAGELKSMIVKKVKRNEPCPCGSGKKYKQCCMNKDQAPRRARAILSRRLADQQENTEDIAEELAAYEATFDEVETATQPMEAHRAKFEQLLKEPRKFADHTHKLFTETRFEPFRYTTTDVRRVCEATAYPKPPSENDSDYAQFLNIATAYLADKKSRLRMGRELLQMLPDYVTEERYLEAWIIQFCAHQMIETPREANPFLIEMLKYGLNEGKAEAAP